MFVLTITEPEAKGHNVTTIIQYAWKLLQKLDVSEVAVNLGKNGTLRVYCNHATYRGKEYDISRRSEQIEIRGCGEDRV